MPSPTPCCTQDTTPPTAACAAASPACLAASAAPATLPRGCPVPLRDRARAVIVGQGGSAERDFAPIAKAPFRRRAGLALFARGAGNRALVRLLADRGPGRLLAVRAGCAEERRSAEVWPGGP